LLQSGSRNVVSNNHIYQHWDGVQDELTATETEPLKYGQDLKVYGNLIEHLGDDSESKWRDTRKLTRDHFTPGKFVSANCTRAARRCFVATLRLGRRFRRGKTWN